VRARSPWREVAVASGGPLSHLVKPDDDLAEGVRFLFNFLDLARPYVSTLVVPACARLPAELFSQCDALLQSTQGAAERPANVLVECKSHHVGAVGITGVTTIMLQMLVIDLPHHAMTIRAGQDRSPAQPIHVSHAGLLTARDSNLEPDRFGNGLRIADGTLNK